jgi:hypothetical protein
LIKIVPTIGYALDFVLRKWKITLPTQYSEVSKITALYYGT